MVAPACETVCGGPSAIALAAQVAALRSAGEVQFGDLDTTAPFVFTGGQANAVTFAGIVLDPSSTDFESPAPGTLQYVGTATKRFYVSYSMTFSWTASTGGVTKNIFLSNLLHKGVLLEESSSGETLDLSGGENYTFFGHSSQTMLMLEPGDTLQVSLDTLIPETSTVSFFALIINAHEV